MPPNAIHVSAAGTERAVDANLEAFDARERKRPVPGDPDVEGDAVLVDEQRPLLDHAIGQHRLSCPVAPPVAEWTTLLDLARHTT